nr:unnamed protein product [Spirometra erinaceieuropaei]
MDILEGVQRRATKAVHGLKNFTYEQRLTALNLYPLYYRQDRGPTTASLTTGAQHPNAPPTSLAANSIIPTTTSAATAATTFPISATAEIAIAGHQTSPLPSPPPPSPPPPAKWTRS